MSAVYSERLELALTTALEAHGLRRRITGVGFEVSHVTAVALIAFDFGFNEDTVVSAFLHDTLEDTDLAPDVIESRFGKHVLLMVQDVTEPPKPAPWRERKTVYINQLRTTPRHGSLAIASADKIHNLSKMTKGLQDQGDTFMRPFTALIDDMVWYQRAVHETLRSTWQHKILDEHERCLDSFLHVARKVSSTQK